jgi:hypothetical protein
MVNKCNWNKSQLTTQLKGLGKESDQEVKSVGLDESPCS